MTRVLLLGTGPLPEHRPEVVDFPRLRSWQFLRAMLEAGFDVAFVAAIPPCPAKNQAGRNDSTIQPRRDTPENASKSSKDAPENIILSSKDTPDITFERADVRRSLAQPSTRWHSTTFEGHPLRWRPVSLDTFDRADLPAEWCQEIRPDVVVSAGPFAAARAAARTPRGIPTWIDLPGDMMAEAQLRAASSADSIHLFHAHQVLTSALARGDAFSVISSRQRDATFGELALMGRFTPENLGWEGVAVIPVGVEPSWRRWAELAAPAEGESEAYGQNAGVSGQRPATDRRRAKGPERKSTRLIWPGAINTWADTRTFFEACALAAKHLPELEIVVTGGPIPGHEERAYEELRRWVDASEQRQRWRFTGWLDPVSAAREVKLASIGVSLDRPCLEAELGSRTRLLYGLSLGLFWLTSPGCELANQLISEGLARAIPHGDSASLSQVIVETAKSKNLFKNNILHSNRAQILSRCGGSRLTRPLVRWIESPHVTSTGIDLSSGLVNRVAELEAELARIHNGPTWRVLGALHRRFKFLFRS